MDRCVLEWGFGFIIEVVLREKAINGGMGTGMVIR